MQWTNTPWGCRHSKGQMSCFARGRESVRARAVTLTAPTQSRMPDDGHLASAGHSRALRLPSLAPSPFVEEQGVGAEPLRRDCGPKSGYAILCGGSVSEWFMVPLSKSGVPE